MRGWRDKRLGQKNTSYNETKLLDIGNNAQTNLPSKMRDDESISGRGWRETFCQGPHVGLAHGRSARPCLAHDDKRLRCIINHVPATTRPERFTMCRVGMRRTPEARRFGMKCDEVREM
jgi:hypothetical protein